MAETVAHFCSLGEAMNDAMMAYASPVGWEHIAFSRDFLWLQAEKSRSRKILVVCNDAQAA